jgi:hypothetical protein
MYRPFSLKYTADSLCGLKFRRMWDLRFPVWSYVVQLYVGSPTAVRLYVWYYTQSTGQCLQRPLIAFDAWLLALGR